MHDGVISKPKTVTLSVNGRENIESIIETVLATKPQGKGYELTLYEKTGLGDGRDANNPWLQEFPDPISRITWDNYVTMSPSEMGELGFDLLERGDTYASVVSLQTNDGEKLELPIIPQPGQKRGTISIALGYGRKKEGKVADGVGTNTYKLCSVFGENIVRFSAKNVTLQKTNKEAPIGATQTHHTLMGRSAILKEASFAEYKKDKKAGNQQKMLDSHKGKVLPETLNLWEDHDVESASYRWGMSIDLTACIGCGSCVTSCQSENNVPVVGKDEVRRAREMHWIRIDRYYSSDADSDDLRGLETASDNPQVAFQPVMCQHCNHAPCETVCPVAATTHSNEGLNQMTYNRCIGTRYCANNCPYKVRRFNWFKYADNKKFDFNMNEDFSKMVLNPDVTVRSRGVMEKCSLCVQRIQDGKLTAKAEQRKVKDGEIKTACQSSCPTNAITFGNLNDEKSAVGKESASERAYELLEEIGVQPNVYYLTKIRNNS